jgi:hypothetical protein
MVCMSELLSVAQELAVHSRKAVQWLHVLTMTDYKNTMLDNAKHSILIMNQPLSHTFKEQQD